MFLLEWARGKKRYKEESLWSQRWRPEWWDHQPRNGKVGRKEGRRELLYSVFGGGNKFPFQTRLEFELWPTELCLGPLLLFSAPCLQWILSKWWEETDMESCLVALGLPLSRKRQKSRISYTQYFFIIKHGRLYVSKHWTGQAIQLSWTVLDLW